MYFVTRKKKEAYSVFFLQSLARSLCIVESCRELGNLSLQAFQASLSSCGVSVTSGESVDQKTLGLLGASQHYSRLGISHRVLPGAYWGPYTDHGV